MKVLVIGKYHHKNQISLNKVIDILKFKRVSDIDRADIVFSADIFIDVSKYPHTFFIFGPHFNVEPTTELKNINNIHNNVVYVQPSQASINIWQNHYNFKIPMKVLYFGVDVDTFKPNVNNLNSNLVDKVLLYYKYRDPNEFIFVKQFLKEKNIKYELFNYNAKYKETDYINTLKKCKYGIWLGCHESQGFALLEALSSNVPLYVWSVTRKHQQHNIESKYKNIETPVTTVPYWNKTCGDVVTNKNDFINNFDTFVCNVNKKSYNPRKYIISNLTDYYVANNLYNIIQEMYPTSKKNINTLIILPISTLIDEQNKLLENRIKRKEQIINGISKFLEYNVSNFEKWNCKIVLSDNTTNTIDNDIIASFNKYKLNKNKYLFKPFINNKYGCINKGAGVLEHWNNLKEEIQNSKWIIHFEPRQLLTNNTFIETFKANNTNQKTYFKFGSIKQNHFYTGLFSCKSKQLLNFMNNYTYNYMINNTISLEYIIYEYFKKCKSLNVINKLGLIWYDTVRNIEIIH